jgi:hypothetical protein
MAIASGFATYRYCRQFSFSQVQGYTYIASVLDVAITVIVTQLIVQDIFRSYLTSYVSGSGRDG